MLRVCFKEAHGLDKLLLDANWSPSVVMAVRKLEKYLTRQFEQHVSRASVEREQKYRIANIDTIRRRLLKLGAGVHASGFERNELFDCGGHLGRQGLKLRLRCHGGKIAMLTLKGPRQNGSQKTRM
jgi:hypothetical protein